MKKLSEQRAPFFEKCPKCGCKMIITEKEDIRTIESAPEVQYISCSDCHYMIGVHMTEEDMKRLDLSELFKNINNEYNKLVEEKNNDYFKEKI